MWEELNPQVPTSSCHIKKKLKKQTNKQTKKKKYIVKVEKSWEKMVDNPTTTSTDHVKQVCIVSKWSVDNSRKSGKSW